MGRHAGFLALGTGKSTGATLTLIPEEFPETTTIQQIADVLEGAMIKRRAMGRIDGVAVVAEGLAHRLGDQEEIEGVLGRKVNLDAAGHIRLAEIPLARILSEELIRRWAARGDSVTVVPQTLGYVLRCAPPTPLDMAYCRDLGNGAIRLLLDESLDLTGGVMATLDGWTIRPMSFAEMVDPKTNRTRIRTVDINSDLYRVARAYMIRLETADLENPVMLAKLATAAKLSEQEFLEQYRRAATRITDQPGAGLNVEIPPPDAKDAAPTPESEEQT
jgi:6-phosphofructokinase 1